MKFNAYYSDDLVLADIRELLYLLVRALLPYDRGLRAFEDQRMDSTKGEV